LLIVEFDRYDIPQPTGFTRVIDPYVLDKALVRRKGSRKLIDTARYYGIELNDEDAHNAAFDSMASVQVARIIGRKFEIDAPIEEVHAMQIKAKAAQARSLQEYLRKKENDSTIVINGEWPIQTKDNNAN
jgi:DNA polymerase-3 subunit epsilon